MILFYLRLIGGFLGFVITRWILYRTILSIDGVPRAMFFLFGGWIVVLFWYALGIVMGAVIIVPAINLVGRAWEWARERGHSDEVP